MKKLLLLSFSFCITLTYPQDVKTGVTEGIKDVIKNQSSNFTDAELKAFLERLEKIKKEIKTSKDYSVETEILDKTEYDTLTTPLKENKIHQLKVETEGNYYVVKYIDLECNINDFIKKRDEYKKIIKDGKKDTETVDEYKKRIEKALKDKNTANPFKISYRYLLNEKNELSSITTTSFSTVSLNLATVPFKIFPKSDLAPSQVSGDIDNVGLYVTCRLWDWSTINAKGNATERSFGFGSYFAPSVVKLDKNNSDIIDDTEINKIYLTTAFAFHLKYGKFTVMLIPAGIDIAFSDSAKVWNYDGKYWWGFGLGVDTSLFNF